MNRKKKRLPGNPRGDAMVVVICLMAILMALSLSMLLAAASMAGTAKKAMESERLRILAESFQDMAKENLENPYSQNPNGIRVLEDFRQTAPGGLLSDGQEKLASLAIRSLQSEFFSETSKLEGGIYVETSEENLGEEVPDRAETYLYSAGGGGATEIQDGYTVEMQVYLELERQLGEEAIEKQRDLHQNDFPEQYAVFGLGDAKLHLVVTAKKGESKWNIHTLYSLILTPGETLPGQPPVIFGKWKKEWSR